MASISNRSPWAVSVRKQPDLYREFRYDRRADAEAYAAELSGQGAAPSVKQLENAFQVMARDKGYLLQLQHGLREIPRISDEVVRAAAAYLGVPVIVARVAAGQISLGDFAMQDERWEARVKNAIEFINADPSYSLLLPPGLETLPMQVKVSIISLYESATGARLISYPEHLFTALDQLQSLLEVDLKPRIKHTVAS